MLDPDNNPLLVQIRILLATNEQLIKTLVEEVKQLAAQLRSAEDAIDKIDNRLAVADNRLDRNDKDNEIVKKERGTMAMMIIGTFLASLLAVVVPMVVKPGAVYNSPGASLGKSA